MGFELGLTDHIIAEMDSCFEGQTKQIAWIQAAQNIANKGST